MSVPFPCQVQQVQKSLDYVYDLQSVTSDACDSMHTNVDTDHQRGKVIQEYVQYIKGIGNGRVLSFFLVSTFLVLLIVFACLQLPKKAYIPIIIVSVIVLFIYGPLYLGIGVVRDKDKILPRLNKRAQYGLSPRQVIAAIQLLPEDSFVGFKGMYDKPHLEFPLDHAMNHYEFPTEWYWLVSYLYTTDEQPRPISLELMFLRQSVLPPNLVNHQDVNQIVEVVMALGDQGTMFHSNAVIPNTSDVIGFGNKCLNVVVGQNRVRSRDNINALPAEWIQKDSNTNLGASLLLSGGKKELYHGDQGFDPPTLKGLGVGTYYYSIPNIQIQGNLTLPSGEVVGVQGVGWLDHQIFSGVAPLGRIRNPVFRVLENLQRLFHPNQVINSGWDYIIVQLSTQESFIFYRGLDKTSLTATQGLGMVGEYSDAQGKQKHLTGVTGIIKDQVAGKDGKLHPCAWEIHVDGSTFEITALLKDAFVQLTRAEFFEVAANVVQTKPDGSVVQGVGWIENVGYQDLDGEKKRLLTLLDL